MLKFGEKALNLISSQRIMRGEREVIQFNISGTGYEKPDSLNISGTGYEKPDSLFVNNAVYFEVVNCVETILI